MKLSAQGAYIHNLAPLLGSLLEKRRKRQIRMASGLQHASSRRICTHGLGPVAQALDIHRGDRMTRW